MTSAADFNSTVIDEFRANAGKVGGMFAGMDMALITTTGAKTGTRRTTPLSHLADGDRIVVIASNGGADTNPAWFHNVKANPAVTVEVGAETFEATAEPRESGPERDALFARFADNFARLTAGTTGFPDHGTTTRVIPVVVLHRVSA